MANALPILLIGGAALLMMGSKKKGDTKTSLPKPGELVLPPTTPPPLTQTVKKSGSGYPGVTRARMQEIQTMLVANGYDVGPKGLDGRYGSATKQAVWEFQEDWGPSIGTPDGKPGPKTQGALEEAEADRVQGQREEAQKFPEEATQLIDECNPLAPGTWGSGNVCEWNGNRWVRATAQASPTPKPKAAPVEDEVRKCNSADVTTWRGNICVHGNGVPVGNWLPKNMSIVLPSSTDSTGGMTDLMLADARYYQRGDGYGDSQRFFIDKPYGDHSDSFAVYFPLYSILRGYTEITNVGIYSDQYPHKYMEIAGVIKNLALMYPSEKFLLLPKHVPLEYGGALKARAEFRGRSIDMPSNSSRATFVDALTKILE